MRLWSLHPQYLDARGLTAAWREALLAQVVLTGRTHGYRHHPQLLRFRSTPAPGSYVVAYLQAVYDEACRRGYCFDESMIGRGGPVELLPVTSGQLRYEWAHLREKLDLRSPSWAARFEGIDAPQPHPLFRIVPGAVADWEILASRKR